MERMISWKILLPVCLFLALALLGSSITFAQEQDRSGAITFEVDGTLRPYRPELPGFDGVTTRPLARLLGVGLHQVDFVRDELVLVTDDPAALTAFLTRWDGVVLSSFDPARYGLKGVSQYLVRVDVNRANPSTLSDNVRLLAPRGSRGTFRVSSAEGLNLLAAAATEAASGLMIGVNWVGRSDGFVERTTAESASGPAIPNCCPTEFGPGGYSANAYDWNYLNGPPSVDTGVTEAWRMLALAGKLGNKVDIAILDMGFLPNADFPGGGVAWSIGGFDPTGTIGLDDPWHGTKVVGAAMGVPDNGFGAAGPAGPIARPILIFTSYDPWTGSIALMNAVALGADIINMSYSMPVPATLSFTVLPFDITTALIRAGGTLIFASAGNDGENVDAEDCFGWCWEEEWVTPCENGGVICVGGLGIGGTWRAANSNYGLDDVDIFAPYTVLVGPDAAPKSNVAQIKNGTSYAAPFAAGVAALIWAADPGRSADEVEAALYVQAHNSPDPKVERYVSAFQSVRSVLGNIPPAVKILQPANNATVSFGGLNMVTFTAAADDYEDAACCALSWTSDKDGSLGTGPAVQFTFSGPGPRTVTATATDSAGAKATASIKLTVGNNTSPQMQILNPTHNQTLYRGFPYVFQGTSFDPNEHLFALPCNSLKWTVQRISPPFPGKETVQGCYPEFTFDLTLGGTYEITLTGTDSEGATGTAKVKVKVVDPLSNSAPLVTIHSPNNGERLDPDTVVGLTGTVKDPDGKSPIEYTWILQDGAKETVLGTGETDSGTPSGANAQWKPSNNVLFHCGGSSVEIMLEASDPDGDTASESIDVTVGYGPC